MPQAAHFLAEMIGTHHWSEPVKPDRDERDSFGIEPFGELKKNPALAESRLTVHADNLLSVGCAELLPHLRRFVTPQGFPPEEHKGPAEPIPETFDAAVELWNTAQISDLEAVGTQLGTYLVSVQFVPNAVNEEVAQERYHVLRVACHGKPGPGSGLLSRSPTPVEGREFSPIQEIEQLRLPPGTCVVNAQVPGELLERPAVITGSRG